MAGGRPTLYSPELIERICERLEAGEPEAQICRDDGMPSPRTIRDWIAKKPEVSAAIARAREIGFDAIAAGTLEIADDARNDWMATLGDEDGGAGYKLNGEHIQRSRLRVDTRLKLLAKWDPKRYGDKLALGGADDLPPMQSVTRIELVPGVHSEDSTAAQTD